MLQRFLSFVLCGDPIALSQIQKHPCSYLVHEPIVPLHGSCDKLVPRCSSQETDRFEEPGPFNSLCQNISHFAAIFLHVHVTFGSKSFVFCYSLWQAVCMYRTRLSHISHVTLRGCLAGCQQCRSAAKSTGGYTVKKFAYFRHRYSLTGVSGSVLSGAIELHEIVTEPVHQVSSLPESGSLIVLGSVLIFGASLLRRRKTERSR
jgi:hypothetical protein